MKAIQWHGDSRKVIASFPEDVRKPVGIALHIAQTGGKAPYAKPLKGYSAAGVFEIVADDMGNAYRAVYAVKIGDVIHVLHAFQKKLPEEIEEGHSDAQVGTRRHRHETEKGIRQMSNVFRELGLKNPEELTLKAALLREIYDTVERRKLTQKAAGEIMGLPQSKVSNLMRGRVDGFSAEKLFACLNALGRDIEIKIKKPIRKSRGELSVAA